MKNYKRTKYKVSNDKTDIKEVLFCYLDILGYKKMVDDFFENPNKEDNLEKK